MREGPMPEGDAIYGDIKVIDVDTHISEPYDLWTSRASPKYRDRVPQMRRTDGRLVWTIDGDVSMGLASAASVVRRDGMKARSTEFTQWRLADVHDGCSQTKARLDVMDESGIWAQIVYPNVLGFGGQGYSSAGGVVSRRQVDSDLRLVSTQIYNDAMAEMQSESDGRLLPMALLPWWDIGLAVVEAERCHAMGLKGVNINSDPQLHGMEDLNGDYWRPLWELCADKDLPVNFHIGASDSSVSWFGDSPWPSLIPEQRLAVGSTMLIMSNIRVLTNLLASGLFERFPKLKFVSVESGIGWIPFVLEAVNYALTESGARAVTKMSLTPKEYFRRNVFACFWFENDDLASTVRRVGVDNVMFESDFPHPTCLFPKPLDQARSGMAELTMEERRKILSGNAARVYNIPIP
jgi:predicted TIM-barrel fold metal-dependent hydrolase